MFKNIGGKIKGLAKVICIVGIAISVVSGLGMICTGYNGAMVGMGLAVMIVGSLASWIGSFFAYGFGELIDTIPILKHIQDPFSPGDAFDDAIG